MWLQVSRISEYVERAASQQQRTFEVAPRRGVLYDRNLHELAMTVLVDSVYAVPTEIATDKDADRGSALANVVHTDPPTASPPSIRSMRASTPPETSPGSPASWIRRPSRG